MLEGELFNEVVWSKLYKRNLLDDIRLPEGILFEDTAFMYRIIHKCQKVACIGESKYHYIKHENSTMERARRIKSIDAVLIYHEMNKFMTEHYQELTDLVALKLADHTMMVLNSIACSERFLENISDYYKAIIILNSHFHQLIKSPYFNKNVKFLLLSAKIHPLFYKLIVNLLIRRNMI